MKTRNILYGYRCENGSLVIDPSESRVFTEMVSMYLSGSSLKQIADTLNTRRICYSPGVTGWNKSRIMRLIFDERYTGSGKYPMLIDRDTYEQLLAKRQENSLLTGTDLSSDLYRLNIPVICPDCGSQMKRRVYDSKRCRKCRICQRCGKRIFINDDQFISAVARQMNAYIETPSLITGRDTSTMKAEPEIKALEREISVMLEHPDLDKELALKKTMELAAIKYNAIDQQYYISNQLAALFRSADTSGGFSAELALRTVREIRIDENADIRIILMNGQAFTEEGA